MIHLLPARWRQLVFLMIAGVICLKGPALFAQEKPPAEETKKQVIQEPQEIYQVTVDDFAKTEAAKAFKEQNYEKALKEFQFLAQLYPRDITIRRFIALSYDRLGRYADAIDAYNNALMLFPYHVATHFYKGLTFIRMGESQKGLNELKFVMQVDPEGTYGRQAKAIDTQVRTGRPPVVEKPPKPWYFSGSAGWMYDTNVIVAPDEKALRGANADLNTMRYELEGTLGYRLILKEKFRLDGEYGFSESFNDDSISELNFHLQRGAVQASWVNQRWGKQWLDRIRHDVSSGWLDNDLFSVASTTTLSTTTSLFKQTRTTLFTNGGYTEFGPDGSNPPFLSRDGLYTGWGINTTFFNEKGTHWITLGYSYSAAFTEGRNFDLSAHSAQVSFHLPLIEKFYADIAGSYQRADYINFQGVIFTDTKRRRDDSWTLSFNLSRPLTQHLTWRAFYRYFDVQNRNDIFENNRSIAGSEIAVQF